MRLTYLVVVLVGASAGGCATITSSELQPINVAAYTRDGQTLDKAKCKLQNDKGIWQVETPGFAEVHRSSEDLTVECRKPGQPDGFARVISRAAAGMYGNIVFGGVVGGLIDHTKGTGYDYPSLINVRMGGAVVLDKRDEASGTASIPPAGVKTAPTEVALAAPESTAAASVKSVPSDPSLPAILPRPGDRWKYQYVDGFNGTPLEIFVHEIVAARRGMIDEKMYVDGGSTFGDERAFTSDSALTLVERRLRRVERLEFDPYLQAFVSEIPFGQFGPFTAPAPDGEAWQFKGRVLGNEMVSVPAGTFDAMKVELNGTRGARGGPPRAVPVQARYVIWYAPKAKRYVKYEVNLWNQYFQPLAKDRFELVDFKLN